MKKPEKNRLPLELQHHKLTFLFNQIRNDCCDEWEKYLPSVEEIAIAIDQYDDLDEIIEDSISTYNGWSWINRKEALKRIAKAVHKRIGK